MLALAGSCFESTRAAGIAFLSGTVTFEGKPAGGATVTVTGNNTTEVTKTDDRGRFSFGNLSVGHYNVTASAQELRKSAQIELGSSGASLFLELSPKIVGSVIVTQPAPIHGSGTDLTLTAQDLARSPASGNLPSLLLQLPGAARGANGVVHINGDHGDVNYILDGVPIPQELNRIIGTELDPSDVAFMDVLQGAYPAQYCKYTPHVTFDVFKGIALTRNLALTARVGNIFSDRYLITYFNAQGNHYAAGRTFDLGVRFGPGEQSL